MDCWLKKRASAKALSFKAFLHMLHRVVFTIWYFIMLSSNVDHGSVMRAMIKKVYPSCLMLSIFGL